MSNQRMGLIKFSQDIQSLHMDRCSIIPYDVTFNCDSKFNQ